MFGKSAKVNQEVRAEILGLYQSMNEKSRGEVELTKRLISQFLGIDYKTVSVQMNLLHRDNELSAREKSVNNKMTWVYSRRGGKGSSG